MIVTVTLDCTTSQDLVPETFTARLDAAVRDAIVGYNLEHVMLNSQGHALAEDNGLSSTPAVIAYTSEVTYG